MNAFTLRGLSKATLRAALILAILLIGQTGFRVEAQAQSSVYFPETGHNVEGEFLTFFNQHSGLKVFGYPITEGFNRDGRWVQYFQKVRMELHPENLPPYRVQLGLLGDELEYRQAPRPQQVANDQSHQYFLETGHTVAYAFLNFYNLNGGLDIFGYPISDFTTSVDGWIVQYFQRARMEWHPELSGDQRVALTDLGSVHFDVAGLNPDLKEPVAAGFDPAQITLKVSATVKVPITGQSGRQTLFVRVSDRHGNPIRNAFVLATVHYPASDQTFTMPATDDYGSTMYTFPIDGSHPGQLVVVAVAQGATVAHNAYIELRKPYWR